MCSPFFISKDYAGDGRIGVRWSYVVGGEGWAKAGTGRAYYGARAVYLGIVAAVDAAGAGSSRGH